MRHRTIKQSFLTATGVLVTGISLAHPSGEHQRGLADGLWHLLTQPDHLLMLFAGGAVVLYTKRRLTAFRQSQRTRDE